ncbi:MAG: rhodanese-like domain-containing protein [Roseiarcus sp.]
MVWNPFSRGAAPADRTAIAHDELAADLKSGAVAVVDVREPDEFASGHIPGAVNLPMSRFDARQLPSGKPVVLVCRSGGRSANALRQALAAGVADARHYPPGTVGWRDRGGPLAR